MTINQHNYEAFLLDYFEGHLDIKTTIELEGFLQNNPSLKATSDGFENISLQPKNIVFENKPELYKLEFEKSNITPANFSDFCIALHENILSENKKTALINFSKKSPHYEEEMNISGKVFLKPEGNIFYPDKNKLYHKTHVLQPKIIRLTAIWGSAAASILIGLLVYHGINKPGSDKASQAWITKSMVQEPKAVLATITTPKTNTSVYPIVKDKASKFVKTKSNPNQISNKDLPVTIVKDSRLKFLIPIEYKVRITQPDRNRYDLTDKIAQLAITSVGNNTYIAHTKEPEETVTAEKNGFLALAESGITKINQLTGSNIELSHQTDETGKVNSISLNTGFFGFYRKRSK